MSGSRDVQRPRGKKGGGGGKLSGEARAASYGIGVVLFLIGVGMLVWFSYTERAPSKLFNLLAAGGVAALLFGVGLFLHPLDEDRLHAFQHEPNPIAVFGIMPIFWKAWML